MDWPFYVVVIIAIASIALNVLFYYNLLPFPDRGSFITTARDRRAHGMLVSMLEKRFGITPRYGEDTNSVHRAMYENDVILNWVAPEFLATLGNPGGGFALVSDRPRKDADAAVKWMRERGYEAAAVEEPGMGGTVVIVTTSALLSGVIVFRLPKHKMGKPQRWQRAK